MKNEIPEGPFGLSIKGIKTMTDYVAVLLTDQGVTFYSICQYETVFIEDVKEICEPYIIGDIIEVLALLLNNPDYDISNKTYYLEKHTSSKAINIHNPINKELQTKH